MSAGDYLEGVAFFLPTAGATLWGALLLLRRRYPVLGGAERIVAYGVLATLGVLGVHLVPAALGILSRPSVLLASLLWLLTCSRVSSISGTSSGDPPSAPGGGRTSARLALVGIGLVGLFTLAFVRDQLIATPASIDFMNFHMPGVARWIQSGSIWQVDALLPFVAPGNYPNNGDVILLAGALPWSNDFLAHLVMLPFFPLTGVAVYALARQLGAVRAAAATAGCLVIAIPAVVIPPLSHAIVDSVMLFTFAAGLVFLLRHHRGGATADLVLAGLALGIAFGTKWYGVSAVAIVVVVWLAARLVGRVEPRVVLRQGAAIVGLVALAGGVWLLRNWIVSGNPFFPVKVDPLGVTIFDAPPDFVREQAGFTIFDYLGDWGAWDEFILPQLRRALAAPALLALAGLLLAAVVLAKRRPKAPQGGFLIASVVCAALVILAYAVTPYTAGGPEGLPVLVGADSRYVVPAIVIAAALAAWVAGTVTWGVAAFCGLGVVAILDGVSWAARGEISAATVEFRQFAVAAFVAALIGVAAWAVWEARARLDERRRHVAGEVAALLLILGAIGVGYEIQKRYNADRYRGADSAIEALLASADGDRRIGLAGLWDDAGIGPPLPAFGTRFDNEVEYVGPFERERLDRYEDRDAFVAALERGDYDYLVIGRGRPGQPRPKDGRWARLAGFELVARSARLDLYHDGGTTAGRLGSGSRSSS